VDCINGGFFCSIKYRLLQDLYWLESEGGKEDGPAFSLRLMQTLLRHEPRVQTTIADNQVKSLIGICMSASRATCFGQISQPCQPFVPGVSSAYVLQSCNGNGWCLSQRSTDSCFEDMLEDRELLLYMSNSCKRGASAA